MPPSRLEAFSDAVIAIAITVLVLGLHVPHAATAGGLWRAIGHEWPYFAGYALSFLTIGIMWVNHHALVHQLGRVSRPILYWNLYLMAWIAIVPFTTELLTENLKLASQLGWSYSGPAAPAAVVYNVSFAFAGTGFLAMWWHLVHHPELRVPGTDIHTAEVALRRSTRGPVLYVVPAVVSAFSPLVGVALAAGIALSFMVGPDTADREQLIDADETARRRQEEAAWDRSSWEPPAEA
jgi:uncharacterized membrane protein